MTNEIKKKLEEKFDAFSYIDYVKTGFDYYIHDFDAKVNFLILLDQSEKNMQNGKKGFIDYYDVDKNGKAYFALNKEGRDYFNKFIVPILMESSNTAKVERYDDKLFGDGQRNDFSENGPIYGVKHSPSVMEQNCFGAGSFVQKPLPDELISGPRGETIVIDKNGNPTMDTHKFAMRYYNKN